MRLSEHTVRISRTLIESYMWDVERYTREKLGVTESDRVVSPLWWYIDTGRASADFLGRLVQVKPYVIGRLLMKGGSDAEVIDRVKARVK